jgi:hypothetical protein
MRPRAHSLPTEAKIFTFADGKSVVTEDVVSGCHVEIEIREREIQEIVLSTRLSRGTAGIV